MTDTTRLDEIQPENAPAAASLPVSKPPTLATLLVDNVRRLDENIVTLDGDVDGYHLHARSELAALKTLAYAALILLALLIVFTVAGDVLAGVLIGLLR